ncbi:MAG: hypothetical protein AAGD04_02605 [Pseudomonadota bacterium]
MRRSKILRWGLVALCLGAFALPLGLGYAAQRCVGGADAGETRLRACKIATTTLTPILQLQPSAVHRLAPLHMARARQLSRADLPDAAAFQFREAYRLGLQDPKKVYELQTTQTVRNLLIKIQVDEQSDAARKLWWGAVLAHDPTGGRALIKYGERNNE